MDSEWVGNEYQLQPPHARAVYQVPCEVEVFHIFVDEAERMRFCRVHPYERHQFHTSVLKEVVHVNFIV